MSTLLNDPHKLFIGAGCVRKDSADSQLQRDAPLMASATKGRIWVTLGSCNLTERASRGAVHASEQRSEDAARLG